MYDPYGAFCKHTDVTIPGAQAGPLTGLTFAAKDHFDVAGYGCCAGNPDWLRNHPPANTTASAIQALLDAGASLVGKTVMDELAYGLSGENLHYGMPTNPRAPERAPGGSSSGSAVAVAAGLADFALGSDTGGSVRVPSSFCGLYGMRPTVGAVSTAGMVPLVPIADTVGWFARDALVLRRIGEVLLPRRESAYLPVRVLIADDLIELVGEHQRAALSAGLAGVVAAVGSASHVTLNPAGYDGWRDAYVTITRFEAWTSHGSWIRRVRPRFSEVVAERFRLASSTTEAEYARALKVRDTACARLRAVLGAGGVLCFPTTPTIAPLRAEAETPAFRTLLLNLTCIASMCALPQVALPLAEMDNLPFGLSLLGGPTSDHGLLELAGQIANSAARRRHRSL
jgi:amidase